MTGLLLAAAGAALAAAAPAPVVVKVDPPGWWAGHSVNPVRLLIRGRNLKGAKLAAPARGIELGGVRVNDAGTAAFVDAKIAPDAPIGARTLRLSTKGGSVEVPFELLAPLDPAGRSAGLSPDDVVYLVLPDRFADGDPSNDDPAKSRGLLDRARSRSYHGGDLRGLIDHLPYLKELGVTALWLTPLYDADDRPQAPTWFSSVPYADYHGYGPVDYYALDEHLGGRAELLELAEKAHALGLKLVLDVVFNHTGARHPWVADPPTATWYHGAPGAHLKNSFRPWLLADPHASPALRREVLEGWLDDNQPDLNQDDPEVARYLIQNALWWVGLSGADALRLDAYDFVPETFWGDCLAALKRQHPGLRAVGEVYSPEPDPALIARFQSGALDGAFDFPLRDALRRVFIDGAPISGLAQALGRDSIYPDPRMLVTFLGLHDDPRFMGRPGATAEGLKLAFAFLLTTRGIPLIYYGDEIAMAGGGEPDNRRDFPGGWPGDRRDAFSSRGRTGTEQGVLEYVERLARLRASSEPLRRGRLVDLAVGERAYAYARVSASGWALVALNNGPKPERLEFDLGPLAVPPGLRELADKLGGPARARVRGKRLSLELPGRSAAVYSLP